MFNDQNVNNQSNGFGKKNSTEVGNILGVQKEVVNVHAMPSKFVTATQRTGHLTTASANKGSGRKLLLITISLILVIIVVIGGVMYFVNGGKDRLNFSQLFGQNSDSNNVANTNANQNTNENINDNTNEVVNDNANQNTNENINDNTNEVVNDNANQNTNENINDNTNETPNYPPAADTDGDGLTSEEELVFGTNPDLEDTDKDGYKDGQEITSLYNPLVPAQDLFSSGLVRKFISSNYGYTFFRPNTWTAKVVGTVSNIVVLPDSESGESFNIEITPNSENKTLTQLLDETGSVFAGQAGNYSLAGVSAYRSLDGRKVWAINNGFIFVISHNVGASGEVSFDNIFEMMLKSFTWIAIESPDVN